MELHVHIPASPLDQFIESFIYYKEYKPVHSIDRFLPDGNINLVIDLKDEPQAIYDNETLREIQYCSKVWFSGIRNNFISIPSGRDSEMFIINFRKGRAFPFVQMPLHEVTDLVVEGELVLTKEILNLREMIALQPLAKQKFICAERFLLRQFGSRLALNPFVDFAVGSILQAPQLPSLQQLAGKTGFSQKHFIKIFKDNVGLTPKGFLRIARFQKAILEIESNRPVHWASIALESGFYDQSHFINDFRAFSGFTPQQYLLKKTSQLNYIPVG